jgi:fucose 4-O-acetylase-like acetyltransferase
MFVSSESVQVFMDLSEKEIKPIRALFREVHYFFWLCFCLFFCKLYLIVDENFGISSW